MTSNEKIHVQNKNTLFDSDLDVIDADLIEHISCLSIEIFTAENNQQILFRMSQKSRMTTG